MLVLLLFADVATDLPVQSRTPAMASARIMRAVAIARNEEWEKAARHNRREILRKEADGRTIVVRVIEHE
jgi:hypothetical protein